MSVYVDRKRIGKVPLGNFCECSICKKVREYKQECYRDSMSYAALDSMIRGMVSIAGNHEGETFFNQNYYIESKHYNNLCRRIAKNKNCSVEDLVCLDNPGEVAGGYFWKDGKIKTDRSGKAISKRVLVMG